MENRHSDPFILSGPPMTFSRFPAKDPRTVARDIPGIFDAIFPQLTTGVVVYFNRKAVANDSSEKLPDELVSASKLSRAMLFEIALARGEQLINGIEKADWDNCLKIAIARQRRHFDATLPAELLEADKIVAERVANNLFLILRDIRLESINHQLIVSPPIPGYQWIASGSGDFSVGTRLIEVKCTNKPFSASDFRQIMIYWLLSYASAIENGTPEWTSAILINPRRNYVLELLFNDIIAVIGAGRSKVEILELFSSMVGDYTFRT